MLFGLRVREVRNVPGVGVVALHGPIDARCVELLQRGLVDARLKGLQSFVLDLVQVRSINSMGLSYLVNLSDVLGTGGEALHLANPQPNVRAVFERMGLSGLFRMHESVASAVRSIAVGRQGAAARRENLRRTGT